MPLESLIPVLPDHEVGARLAENYLTYSQRRGKWGRVEVCCGTAQSGEGVYTRRITFGRRFSEIGSLFHACRGFCFLLVVCGFPPHGRILQCSIKLVQCSGCEGRPEHEVGVTYVKANPLCRCIQHAVYTHICWARGNADLGNMHSPFYMRLSTPIVQSTRATP